MVICSNLGGGVNGVLACFPFRGRLHFRILRYGGFVHGEYVFPVRGVYPVVRVLILPPKAPLVPGGPYGPGGLTRPLDPAEEQRERETERERGRREREREREGERDRERGGRPFRP